ncbi:MAG: sulfite exporter TauE/SafE family protein [Acidobacteriota bacterium]
MMRILLPIAGISVHIWAVVGIGAVIGLLSGLLGIGGGFLMTPILMMIGVPPTVAAASGTNAIVATSSSGVAAHFRLRNVDYKMGAILLSGGLTGSWIGVHFLRALLQLGSADLTITLTYIVMLGLVGAYILRDSWRKMRSGLISRPRYDGPSTLSWLLNLPLQIEFPHSGVRHSAFVPFALCLLVGVLTAIMGVAGGFVLVPMMVYLLRMPAHVAVGTSLFQALFTCAGATVMQAGDNQIVDVVLALLVAVGSTLGAQMGARLSRHLRGEQLMILLGILALGVMADMVAGLVLGPSVTISQIAELNLPTVAHHAVCLACGLGRVCMG